MPPTFTVGENSFVTVAEFDLYMERIPVVYQGELPTYGIYKKEQLLIWATQLINTNICWPEGSYRSFPSQLLDFPRIGMYSPDGTYLLDWASIPYFIKDATCQLAYELSKTDLTAEPPRGLESLKVGPITIEFDTNHSHDVRVIPRSVWTLLRPFGGYPCGRSGGVYTVPLYRS